MPEDHALPRLRAVHDADSRLVGHVAEVVTDAEGKVSELVLDLTADASERMFGPGMKHGVLTLGPSDVHESASGVTLKRDLAAMRLDWQRRADADEDERD